MKVTIQKLWPLLLPVVIMLPGLEGFAYPSPEGGYSDIAITHYPNALFLKRTILELGEIPLWSPTILSGYPFFANPLSGLHYPPGWIALLFPLPMGLNITFLLHLLWGGMGMYIFLRSQQISHLPAIFSALAFESLPKIYAHFGAGHLTMLYAVSWTPWLFYSLSREMKYHVTFSGGILAIIILADPRWAVYAGITWLVWEISLRKEPLFSRLIKFGKSAVIGTLLSSPLLIPLAEYTLMSTRANLSPVDVFAHSMPPTRIFGLLFPDFSGPHEWILYVGGIVLILSVVALSSGKGFKRTSFWGWVFFLSLVFSMGEYFPGMRIIANVPGLSLLRVPSRALFLSGFSAVILAGIGFDRLFLKLQEPVKKRIRLFAIFIMSLTLAFALVIWIVSGELLPNIIWGTVFISATAIWVLLALVETFSRKITYWCAFILLLIDLGYVNQTLFSFRSSDDVLSEGSAAAELLANETKPLRVYSPSYSIPQQTAAYFGLELADGVDPLQLNEYVNYMARASGIPHHGYSITVPPFGDDDPNFANAGFTPTPLFSNLNVHYIISEFDLEIDNVVEIRIGTSWIFEFSSKPSYVRVEPDIGQHVEVISRSPNRIVINAEGPGTLIISEIPYPGWQVLVDGKRAEINTYNGINRSVDIGAGEKRVTFVFRPYSLYLGLGISAVTLGIILQSSIIKRKKSQYAE